MGERGIEKVKKYVNEQIFLKCITRIQVISAETET